MSSIRAVIVDDEDLARENLRMILTEHFPEVTVIGTAGGVQEGVDLIRNMQPELVFLDIRMPSGIEGFTLLDAVSDLSFQVVFVTAFHDYAIKAFNANALHYVLKPIDIEDLELGIEKVKERLELFKENPKVADDYHHLLEGIAADLKARKSPSRITISHAKGFKIVDESEIVSLEAEGNCTMLRFTNNERYLDTRTLKVYEELLNPLHFYRIHKSHLINLAYLKEFITDGGPAVIMSDGSSFPVARKRLADFTARVKSQF